MGDVEVGYDSQTDAIVLTESYTPRWLGNRRSARPFCVHVLKMIDVRTVGDLNVVTEYMVERGRRLRAAMDAVAGDEEDPGVVRRKVEAAAGAMRGLGDPGGVHAAMVRLVKGCVLPELDPPARVRIRGDLLELKTVDELLAVAGVADAALVSELCAAILQAATPSADDEKN